MTKSDQDKEANRFSARMGRYAKVGTNVGGIVAKMAGARLFGVSLDRNRNASELTAVLGNLKGPMMKVAQLIATIPDAIPPEYAEELATLQASAPPMGRGFVKRRMAAELGPDWLGKFSEFERQSSAAASLGQVHKAVSLSGEKLACKLQYPDMDSAVEADLQQMAVLFSIHKRLKTAIDATDIAKEIGDRVREELDYLREARHMKMYGTIFKEEKSIKVPIVHSDLSTGRLLTMNWLTGDPLVNYKNRSLEQRNNIAKAMFLAWWHPFSHYGVIHGDPHLGNYTVFEKNRKAAGINLLDYGCIRIFSPKFVQGVVDLYHGLRTGDSDQMVSAYESWGFTGLNAELIEILNIWASFIYGPLLEDRVRSLADGTSPASYGRREAFRVHQALREKGPVRIPREFVFMDRAAIGLGGVFIHLRAELNFYHLFNEQIASFSETKVLNRQKRLLKGVGLELAACH